MESVSWNDSTTETLGFWAGHGRRCPGRTAENQTWETEPQRSRGVSGQTRPGTRKAQPTRGGSSGVGAETGKEEPGADLVGRRFQKERKMEVLPRTHGCHTVPWRRSGPLGKDKGGLDSKTPGPLARAAQRQPQVPEVKSPVRPKGWDETLDFSLDTGANVETVFRRSKSEAVCHSPC